MDEFMYMLDELLNSPDGAAVIAQLIVQLVVTCIQMVVTLVFFIMTAVGFYTIAKRRGIRHAWLAWIPVGREWILGSISDQYHQVVKGERKGKRKAMLTLSLLSYAGIYAFLGLLIAVIVFLVRDSMGYYVDYSLMNVLNVLWIGQIFLVLGFSIAQTVIYYMALYDVYRAASPSNAVLFLVLSIFVSITTPFFVFFNRKKDEGMIPQRPAFNPYQQPVYRQPAPQQPVYQQPAPQQPVYQQPAPQQPVYQEPAPQQPADPAPQAPQQDQNNF